MAFDGTDDFVRVSDDDVFTFTDGTQNVGSDKPFSIQAWVMIDEPDLNLDGARQGVFVSKFRGNTNVEYFFGQLDGRVLWNLYDNNAPNNTDDPGQGHPAKSSNRIKATSGVIAHDVWNHVVVTYDGSKHENGLNIYVNAVLNVTAREDTNDNYNGMVNTNLDVVIGSTDDGSADFEKKMTNVAMFNKELSVTEVSELYNNGRVLNLTTFSDYNSVIAWWKLGDGDTLPTAIDSKGGRNGTVTNATLVDEPGAARPGIFATDGFSTENQRYLNLRISEAGDNAQPAVTVWLKSYGMGYDRWAKLDTFSGVQNSVVTHVIDINGADRALLIWDGNGNDVKISAGCSTF